MPSLAYAARNGALAAVGLYLIVIMVALALSYGMSTTPIAQVSDSPLQAFAGLLPRLLGNLTLR
ncbi:conserved hypothetical protein [Pseudomonas sp. 8Z]|uniref:hypothetical protein n=1 Tax=Pseudomonas sp. 8Z TaxID=2653166 RepID=UPI0012F23ABF|nr:hypothetical protein [Pseudomonas sp. 8Z]VXC66051.1 conserved hypothetical protein [Pseudomonas sp. 8Z]